MGDEKIRTQVELSKRALNRKQGAFVGDCSQSARPAFYYRSEHAVSSQTKSQGNDGGAPSRFAGTGFVRLKQLLAPKGPICVSPSGWWAGVKSGRYPKPVKLSPRVTAWRVEDILKLISDVSDAD